IRKPDERHAEKAEVGVDERDSLIETNAGVRRIELPLGVSRVADGNPGAVDEVDVAREAFDVPCLKVERTIGNQQRGIRPPLDFDVAANVVKAAMTGADVELSFVGFEVLAVVIELPMAAGGRFLAFAVVFDVIRPN